MTAPSLEDRARERIGRIVDQAARKVRRSHAAVLVSPIRSYGDDSEDRRVVLEELSTERPGLRRSHSAWPDSTPHPDGGTSAPWPECVPKPLRVGAAVAFLEEQREALAAELASDLRAAVEVLTPPERQVAILARPEVLARWPLPQGSSTRDDPTSVAWRVLETLCRRMKEPPPEAIFDDGPPTIPSPKPPGGLSAHVLRAWSVDRLRQYARRTHDRTIDEYVSWWDEESRLYLEYVLETYHATTPPTEPPLGVIGVHWRWDDRRLRVPGSALGLLFVALRAVEAGVASSPSVVLVPAAPVPSRVMETLGGADLEVAHPRSGSKLFAGDSLVRVTFRSADGDPEEIELPFDGDEEGRSVLSIIARRYGSAAVRDVLGMFLFHWAARARPSDPVWWWPDEHLEVLGLSADRDARSRLVGVWKPGSKPGGLLGDLDRSLLTAHFRDGAPVTGPVRPILTWEEPSGRAAGAVRSAFHPLMFDGVTTEDGSEGSYFWPVPLRLVRLAANRSRVHVLPAVLGPIWRKDLRDATREHRLPVARKNMAALVAALGIQGRGRARDPDAAEQVRRALEDGQTTGLVRSWKVERGDMDRLDGTVVVEAAEIEIKRPAWLPSTGGDLAGWLDRIGWNTSKASEALGLDRKTLSKAAGYGSRPLPSGVRQALRRFLWPTVG